MKRRKSKRINVKGLWVLSVLIILTLSALYIYQISEDVSRRFAADEYGRKIDRYSKENKSLEVALTEQASLSKISENVKTLGYSNTGKIQYIKVMNNRVVANYSANEKLAD
ncbi:MAG: hypothetical protein Q8N69_02355 [bacterium]|nr:hypothetical protein [bacterium]